MSTQDITCPEVSLSNMATNIISTLSKPCNAPCWIIEPGPVSKHKADLHPDQSPMLDDYKLAEKFEKYCVEDCPLNRSDKGDMLRCGICMNWFHCKCVNVDPKVTGAWTCLKCRHLGQSVTILRNECQSLKDALVLLIRATTAGLPEQLKDVNFKLEKMTQEVESLRAINVDLMSQLTYANQKKETLASENRALHDKLNGDVSKKRTMVIGSSITKDILSKNPERLIIKSFPGASISKITEELRLTDDHFDEVKIVVGGNDCASEGATTKVIIDRERALLQEAVRVGHKITVSSVLPRCNNDGYHLIADHVNEGISRLCKEIPNCVFVNNDSSFKLSDQSPNDALYLNDGVHLNAKGTYKLIEKLGLSSLAKWHNSRRVSGDPYKNTQHNKRTPGNYWKSPTSSHQWNRSINDRNDQGSFSHEHQWNRNVRNVKSQSTHDQNQSYNPKCYFCGYTGHISKNCRWGVPAVCHFCGERGHVQRNCPY